MINPVRLTRKEPISQYSSVYGCWLDEYPCNWVVWFMTRIGCWLSYEPGCWLFSCVACADIDRQIDMTHAITMFLRYDFIIYFHVFEFIYLTLINIQQNNIGDIDAGQNNNVQIRVTLQRPPIQHPPWPPLTEPPQTDGTMKSCVRCVCLCIPFLFN